MGFARPGCRITAGSIVFDGIDLVAAERRAAAASSGARASPMWRKVPPPPSTPPIASSTRRSRPLLGPRPRAARQGRAGDAVDLYRRLQLPNPEHDRPALSPPGVGRPAAARHDRHGDVVPPRPHHLRRADHRARRHHPGRGARRHARHRRAVQHRGDLHHP